MKPRFQVSDKVVLLPGYAQQRGLGIRPRLRHDRVYCVREVGISREGTPYVRLVGVRCPVYPEGDEGVIVAEHFRRIGTARENRQTKGGA